jgi:3-oxoacid CoA-transferase subunit B
VGVVNRLVTDLGVFDITDGGLRGIELASGVTPAEVRLKTGCHVQLSHLEARA